ncbi:tetratricopeptide repeat protein [uncultured Hydrogenophaga sp.]|uniref:tetratricopeptide repeat protein n=1 Tax=uncultured Hydrogenophaga sp. TaxID=199683 RepID=UPI00265F6B23|nr:tetratricopeptide repeat protein [uncultured Hydrogenophaga sp.]
MTARTPGASHSTSPFPGRLRPAIGAMALASVLALASVPAGAQTPAEPTGEPVVNSSLSAPLFYQLLLGELNVREGDPGAGYSLILDAARRTKDPQLYQRAVEVALQGRSGDAALAAARAWAQELPGSLEADRFVLQILLALNRVGETGPVLRDLIRDTPLAERSDTINAIPQTFARVQDKAVAASVVREAVTPSLTQPETAAAAWTTVGRMELAQNRSAAALEAARQGHSAEPASPYPALLALELFERGDANAEPLILRQINASSRRSANDTAVALNYARLLIDLQRNGDARRELASLTTRQPDEAEAWLLLASVQLQDNALQETKASLGQFLRLTQGSSDPRLRRLQTQAYLMAAQVAEKQGDIAGAGAWLDRIESPEDVLAAQLRRASLLARQGRLGEGRALLRSQPERRPGDARLKLIAEAQLLRDFKAYREAYDVYGEAVRRFPEDTDLLYEQAMVAEKSDRLADMERLLRELIQRKPDFHHAYNALGYSLADRNLRLPEAKTLIEKAVSLAPDDPFIQDSLGWVEFRLGNLPRSIEILTAAYRKRPDAEIAAHLGEALWAAGQRDQARKIWREGLLTAPDNETLLSTLKRLQVQP